MNWEHGWARAVLKSDIDTFAANLTGDPRALLELKPSEVFADAEAVIMGACRSWRLRRV
jgi:hypothetical protein